MEINKISSYQYHSDQSISSSYFHGRKMTLVESANLSKLNQLEGLTCIFKMDLSQQAHLERLVQGVHRPLSEYDITVP
ncbi:MULTISPECIES: hypothetical protein [unclassified Arsenophonus]|uniref:hypothetical protein n=2 Tax=Arsenophonus TaxID=637 RepID=UPI0028615C7A|nr:hypothetical protein [Arsenophonus sp.]MDR5611054.1 hypothetical protein [Arsenophonus sp.]MDR5614996.1 hypothetical protein [Arsenophonus sp.]MDR5617697.1 hypothetical protein [Arsenophonus sp.]